MLIINPNNRIQGMGNLPAIEPPLWAGLIASYMNADILDAEALDLTVEETIAEVNKRKPEDIGIVVMGNNPSVSSTPKWPVAEQLLNGLNSYGKWVTGIHPIAVKTHYPTIEFPFKGFPMIPFDKLPMDKYRAHNWHCLDGSPRSPYASIYTSLGCPFKCYYCNINVLYGGHKITFRPYQDIFKEVELLVNKYKVKNIKIWDELFTLREDRVSTIYSGLKDYNLNIWAYARADTVTVPMLQSMKRGGIKWLAYGFESADFAVRKGVNKNFRQEQVDKVISMTKHTGINIIANFMFGLPEDTEDTMKRTLEFAQKKMFEFVNFYDAKPYPGSQWFTDIRKAVIPDSELDNEDWREFSQFNKISEFRQKAFEQYFSNTQYLGMIDAKFGKQGVTQIKEMLSQHKEMTNVLKTVST